MELNQNRIKSDVYLHHPPERLNCAQAILKSFRKEFNVPEETIIEFKAWGGGRAEKGMCGALFSAEYLYQQKENTDLEQEFKSEMGTIYCRELKRTKKACEDCVRVADSLIERRLKR